MDADLAKLEALKQRLREDVDRLKKKDSAREMYAGSFEELVTAAQLASQAESDELLRRRLERRLAELERINQRIEEGKYGTCESCGEPIPQERLEASELGLRSKE